MLFKQIQLFQLKPSSGFFYDQLVERLQLLPFQACLPSISISAGWVAPVDESNASLVEQINNRLMICMQVEEEFYLPRWCARSWKKKSGNWKPREAASWVKKKKIL